MVLYNQISSCQIRQSMAITTRFNILLLSLGFLTFGGCVVIPIPTGQEDPYDKVNTDLLVGQTNKVQVRTKLGNPAAIYSQDSTYVYTATQANWEIAWLVVGTTGAGAGMETEGEQHFLILEFDEQGTLIDLQLDISDDNPGSCSKMGICHDGAGHVVMLASKAEEAEAKQFPISSTHCGTYLYLDIRNYFGNRNTGQIKIYLDGEYMGYAGQWRKGSFFYWSLDPGRHEISYFPNPGALTFDCRDGELVFVLLRIEDSKPLSLELVSNSEGRKQIGAKGFYLPKRRLIIPESG